MACDSTAGCASACPCCCCEAAPTDPSLSTQHLQQKPRHGFSWRNPHHLTSLVQKLPASLLQPCVSYKLLKPSHSCHGSSQGKAAARRSLGTIAVLTCYWRHLAAGGWSAHSECMSYLLPRSFCDRYCKSCMGVCRARFLVFDGRVAGSR